MQYICSLIVVEDVTKSRYLYENILGQKVKTDFGENVAFECGFAIHQEQHFKSLIERKEIKKESNAFELYFEDDDVKKYEVVIKSLGLKLIHETRKQPWEQMVLRFYDYDGNIIEIGERMEHVAFRMYMDNKSIEEIVKVTYLPIEIVEKSIEEFKNKA